MPSKEKGLFARRFFIAIYNVFYDFSPVFPLSDFVNSQYSLQKSLYQYLLHLKSSSMPLLSVRYLLRHTYIHLQQHSPMIDVLCFCDGAMYIYYRVVFALNPLLPLLSHKKGRPRTIFVECPVKRWIFLTNLLPLFRAFTS